MFIIDSKLYNQRKRLADRIYNSKFCKETYHSPYENVLKHFGYIHIKSSIVFKKGFENIFNYYKSVYKENGDYKDLAKNGYVIEDETLNKTIYFEEIDKTSDLKNKFLLSLYCSNSELIHYYEYGNVCYNLEDIETNGIVAVNYPVDNIKQFLVIYDYNFFKTYPNDCVKNGLLNSKLYAAKEIDK